MHSDTLTLSSREQGLITTIIYVFGVFLCIHFTIKLLWYSYLSKKIGSLKMLNDSEHKFDSSTILEENAHSGYKRIVSKELGFSFCYPENWQIIRSKQKLLFIQIKEVSLEQGMTILRNFNISHQNIEGVQNTNFLFQAIISGVMKSIGAKLEFKEPFNNEETFGMRYKLKYTSPMRTDLCCYQIALTNQSKKSLVLISFTSGSRDFPKTKKLFDEIANSVEFIK